MNLLLSDQTRIQLAAIAHVRSGSYIFHGHQSVGKATATHELARQLNCQGDNPAPCRHCRQFQVGAYPDYLIVRSQDKPSILIEQIRTLIQSLALSPYYASGARVVVIDPADTMTLEAQNALLKLIEEPPPQTLFILITERPNVLLPTVRSRCGQVHFPRQTPESIARLLVQAHGTPSVQATDLATAANGSPGRAIHWLTHPELAAERLEQARQAASVPSLRPFDRLLLAARLAAGGSDLTQCAALLHDTLTAAVRAGSINPAAARHGLDALERFRSHLQAKVSPRVALERLMLEL